MRLALTIINVLALAATLNSAIAQVAEVQDTALSTYIESLHRFESSVNGRRVDVTVELSKMSAQETLETSADGSYVRLASLLEGTTSKGTEYKIQSAYIVDLSKGFGFSAQLNTLESSNRPMLRYYSGDAAFVQSKCGGFSAFALGKASGVPFSTFVSESECEVTHSAGVGRVTAVHPTKGKLLIEFDAQNRLSRVTFEREAGAQFPNEATRVLTKSIAHSFVYALDATDLLLKSVRIDEFGNASETSLGLALEYGAISDITSDVIDIPTFSIDDGTFVQVESINGIDTGRYEFHNGQVTKIADQDALAAARLAKFKKPTSRRWWYALMGVAGCAAIGLLIWIRAKA